MSSLREAFDTAKRHPILTTLASVFALVAGSRLFHAFQRDPVNAGIGTAFGLATGALTKRATGNNWVAAGAGIAGGVFLPHAAQRFAADVVQRTVDIPHHNAEQLAAMVATFAAVYGAAHLIPRSSKPFNALLGYVSSLYAYAYMAPIVHPVVEAVAHALK